MNSEIVPALDGSETPSIDTARDSNVIDSKAQGSYTMEDIRPFDLLDLGRPENAGVIVGLMGGDHHTRRFLASDKGHKHVTQFNPTLDSLRPIIKRIKEPSVLLLRGCYHLLLQLYFPLDKLETLTAFEISRSSHLTTDLPISRMTQLQSLNLSHLLIKQLPDDLFNKLTNLRSLILRGCRQLGSIPSIKLLQNLEVLDLSHCSALQTLEPLYFSQLRMLDLSYTGLAHAPFIGRSDALTHVFFRDAKVLDLKEWKTSFVKLRVIDLSGARNVKNVEWLEKLCQLEAVDLSRTSINSIDLSRYFSGLRILLLRDCTRLHKLGAIKYLRNLELLDLSGCEKFRTLPSLSELRNLRELNLSGCSRLKGLSEGFFNQMSCLEKLDLSKTNFNFDHLPSFANLINLRTLNLSQTSLQKVPDLSNLRNLKILVLRNCQKLEELPNFQTLTNLVKVDSDLLGSDGNDFIRVHSSGMGNIQQVVGWDGTNHPRHLQESISMRDEFHLVSTLITDSGFDQFKYSFKTHDNLIQNILNYLKSGLPTTSNDGACDITCSSSSRGTTQNQVFKRQIESLHADLEYIQAKIDFLESSCESETSEELLHDLVKLLDRHQADTIDDSADLQELLRVVAKLKLLVPPPPEQVDDLKKKKMPVLTTSEVGGKDVDDINIDTPEMQSLLQSYESLTDIQRKCLLYFASLPCGRRQLAIKKRIVIQLWWSEGLINPVSYANSVKTFLNPNPEMGTGKNIDSTINNANETGPDRKGLVTVSTLEIGQQIVEALLETGFISQGREALLMYSWKHSFVMKQAKTERFFKMDNSEFMLIRRLSGFGNQLPLNTTRTLLNVDATFINIEAEFFSKLRNLSVLSLGSWKKHIDVADVKFLEELKHMKQLKILSFERFAGVTSLPDSVCEVTSLVVLNLRQCTFLKELPAGIGSLKHLTYLDVTNCCLLSNLPKGLKFLSKLQVLKGFVITYKPSGRQNNKACTLRDLSMLEDLSYLSLRVNKDKFPDPEALHVLHKMKNLRSLKITWEKHYFTEQQPPDTIGHCRWLCWGTCASQNETEEQLGSGRLGNLKKLVLCCYPLETAPHWLHPSELQKLEKLYILGGDLKTIPGGTDQDRWNVTTLHLKYLHNLDLDSEVLTQIFPNMTYCEMHELPHIRNFSGCVDKLKGKH